MIAPMIALGIPAAPECTFVAVLALVLLGPKKLPVMARSCAKLLCELQNAKEEFTREILQIPIPPKIQEPLEKKVHQAVLDSAHFKKE